MLSKFYYAKHIFSNNICFSHSKPVDETLGVVVREK